MSTISTPIAPQETSRLHRWAMWRMTVNEGIINCISDGTTARVFYPETAHTADNCSLDAVSTATRDNELLQLPFISAEQMSVARKLNLRDKYGTSHGLSEDSYFIFGLPRIHVGKNIPEVTSTGTRSVYDSFSDYDGCLEPSYSNTVIHPRSLNPGDAANVTLDAPYSQLEPTPDMRSLASRDDVEVQRINGYREEWKPPVPVYPVPRLNLYSISEELSNINTKEEATHCHYSAARFNSGAGDIRGGNSRHSSDADHFTRRTASHAYSAGDDCEDNHLLRDSSSPSSRNAGYHREGGNRRYSSDRDVDGFHHNITSPLYDISDRRETPKLHSADRYHGKPLGITQSPSGDRFHGNTTSASYDAGETRRAPIYSRVNSVSSSANNKSAAEATGFSFSRFFDMTSLPEQRMEAEEPSVNRRLLSVGESEDAAAPWIDTREVTDPYSSNRLRYSSAPSHQPGEANGRYSSAYSDASAVPANQFESNESRYIRESNDRFSLDHVFPCPYPLQRAARQCDPSNPFAPTSIPSRVARDASDRRSSPFRHSGPPVSPRQDIYPPFSPSRLATPKTQSHFYYPEQPFSRISDAQTFFPPPPSPRQNSSHVPGVAQSVGSPVYGNICRPTNLLGDAEAERMKRQAYYDWSTPTAEKRFPDFDAAASHSSVAY